MHIQKMKFGLQEDILTITVVTMALTSPLCAMVSSLNRFTMRSMCFSLPFSAKTTG